jgi:aminoglycoside/choline kinase family phosphotransferase
LSKKVNKFNTYKKIIDLLIRIQKIKPKKNIKNVDKSTYEVKKYSNKFLLEESNLFFDWYLPLFLTKKKALNIKKKSNKMLLKIYKKINFSNSCFVHRDYHAQNLMKVGKKIGVIDSQDALFGNPAYDLVSIIDDVRIKTPTKLKNRIYIYYLKKKSRSFKKNSSNFLEDFEILSFQRILKII